MPELPEVETIARSLRPHLSGRRLRNFQVLRAGALQSGGHLTPLLEGARFLTARRRAKLLLLDLETADTSDTPDKSDKSPLLMAFHLKMTGSLLLRPAQSVPGKHSRLFCDLWAEGGAAAEARLFFDDIRTFGYCRILRPEELGGWPFWTSLGPEPLESGPEELAEALERKGGALKGALLDQRVIAGIGNIYADEALFRAGLRPERKAASLSAEKRLELAAHIQTVLREAIAACGSSIRDYQDAEGRAGAFQNSFNVYGRGGETCRRCGTRLASCRVAGRGTVYCPRCQS